VSTDFLAQMAAQSHGRCAQAQQRQSLSAWLNFIADASNDLTPHPLKIDGFGVIAEVKRRSPALGDLNTQSLSIAERVGTYAQCGASAISVLTEPEHFLGDLTDLRTARIHALNTPLMRKDFIVDPYQVVEGKAYGASGVLLIVRMLDAATTRACLSMAMQLEMFVVLECFDADDIKQLNTVLDVWQGPKEHCLIGVNSRNLATLQVIPSQLASLVTTLPQDFLKVAESGLESPADARRLAELGYDLALVGTALMRAPAPGDLLSLMVKSGQQGRSERR
jgi:indole-3-glycerol phosphate synthase